MKKITVKLTAIVLSAFIFLGGVGGSYIEGYCADPGTRFLDVVWNYDESISDNLAEYIRMIVQVGGAVAEPGPFLEVVAALGVRDFLEYMNSDKGVELTEEEIPQYFEENVRIHGGGGLSFSDDIVDALHHTAQAILDEQSGYWLYPTVCVDDVPVLHFKYSETYSSYIDFVKNTGLTLVSQSNANGYYLYGLLGKDFIPESLSDFENSVSTKLYRIKPDWTYVNTSIGPVKYNGSQITINTNSLNLSSYDLSLVELFDTGSDSFTAFHATRYLVSPTGAPIRVWKSVDAYKLFSVGRQPYYCTPEWVNYDYSQDNSMTLTNTYLGNVVNGGVVNNYYNVVQDAIDENNADGSLTEEQIRDIVADTIKQIQQDNNTESDSGGSGSDDNGSGGGIIAIIEGIGKFFDTLLTLVGNVIGMIADFGNSVLEMFGSLGTFTEGFSSFLSGTFGFIPEEVWKVLMSGITLSVLLLGIKFFK